MMTRMRVEIESHVYLRRTGTYIRWYRVPVLGGGRGFGRGFEGRGHSLEFL